jgi:hypothetical protein
MTEAGPVLSMCLAFALHGEVRRVRDSSAQRGAEDHRPRRRQQVARPEPARGDLHQGPTDYERYSRSLITTTCCSVVDSSQPHWPDHP